MRPLWVLLLAGFLLTACQPKKAEPSLAENASTQELQAKYQGQQVWVYGGGPLRCVLSDKSVELVMPISTAARVTKIERLPSFGLYAVEIGANGHIPAQTVKSPIVLTLKPEMTVQTSSVSSGGTLPPWQSYLQGHSCQEFKVAFTGVAHLERTLSLKPPSAAVIKLVQSAGSNQGFGRSSRVGLTHEQALWLQGPPDEPLADFTTLMQAQTWTVMGAPGYGDWVLKFQGDKVVEERAPTPMP